MMLSRASDFDAPERRAPYANLFRALAITPAVKSNLEAVELSGLAGGRWLAPAPLATIGAGIAIALFRGRNVPLPWPELRLRHWDGAAMVAPLLA